MGLGVWWGSGGLDRNSWCSLLKSDYCAIDLRTFSTICRRSGCAQLFFTAWELETVMSSISQTFPDPLIFSEHTNFLYNVIFLLLRDRRYQTQIRQYQTKLRIWTLQIEWCAESFLEHKDKIHEPDNSKTFASISLCSQYDACWHQFFQILVSWLIMTVV